VFARCQAHDVPVAIAMAGGYARQIDDTVAIHATTIRLARQLWR
jgi:acetoin utilization deacetylase AcuC-like enzyme